MTIDKSTIRNAAETKPICRSDPEKKKKKKDEILWGFSCFR